jgi:D-alanyl-D-alanine carboxypeptidase
MRTFALSGFLGIACIAVFYYALITPETLRVASVEAQTALSMVALTSVPEVTAQAYYVFEVETGAELTAKNPDMVRPLASVTKLISSAVFFDTAELTGTIAVTERDVATPGASGRLQVGEEYSLRELVFPALLESSNDASTMQARSVSETDDLIKRMNEYTEALGLPDTHFVDPSGLSPENVSSPRSLSILLRTLVEEQPHLIDITKLRKYVGSTTTWLNNSPLASMSAYAGGKHGYTPEAGRTAVVMFEERTQGTTRTIGYIVLGSDDLVHDITALREAVQRAFGESLRDE